MTEFLLEIGLRTTIAIVEKEMSMKDVDETPMTEIFKIQIIDFVLFLFTREEINKRI